MIGPTLTSYNSSYCQLLLLNFSFPINQNFFFEEIGRKSSGTIRRNIVRAYWYKNRILYHNHIPTIALINQLFELYVTRLVFTYYSSAMFYFWTVLGKKKMLIYIIIKILWIDTHTFAIYQCIHLKALWKEKFKNRKT